MRLVLISIYFVLGLWEEYCLLLLLGGSHKLSLLFFVVKFMYKVRLLSSSFLGKVLCKEFHLLSSSFSVFGKVYVQSSSTIFLCLFASIF